VATIRKIEQKSGTRYQAIIRFHDEQLTRTFRRRSDATKWADKTEKDIEGQNAGLMLEGQRKKLRDAIKRYKTEILPGKSKGTQNAYTGQLEYWESALGSMRLADVSNAQIAEHRDLLADENIAADGKPARRRSPATINRYLAALGAVFSAAVNEWHWLAHSPVKATKKRKEPRGRTRFLSKAEVKRLLEACRKSESPELFLAVLLSLTTGARRGEIMNLRWECIDWERGTAYIPETKNGDPRLLAIVPDALQLLRDRREMGRAIKMQGLIFPSLVSDNSPILLEKAWRTAKARAGLTNFRWHDLRHSAASFMAANGATLLEIGATLGHRSTQTTARYSHLVQDATHDLMRDTMNKVLSSDE
jgi:integrase